MKNYKFEGQNKKYDLVFQNFVETCSRFVAVIYVLCDSLQDALQFVL